MLTSTPSSGGRVRVYVKRQLRFDLLDFNRQQMYRLGVFGVAEVLGRVRKAIGPEDGPAKPLKYKYYAKVKSRFGLSNKRDLWGFGRGGHMLDNLKVRTVGTNDVRAGFSTKRARDKAAGNTRIQPFLVFSPSNVRRVSDTALKIFQKEIVPGVVTTKLN
jgi:hypothetical protein